MSNGLKWFYNKMAIPNDLIRMLVWLHQITLVVQFVLFLHCAAIFDWYVDEQHFNRILINILFKVAPVLNYFNFTSIQKKFLGWNLLYESLFLFKQSYIFYFLKSIKHGMILTSDSYHYQLSCWDHTDCMQPFVHVADQL